ncbi:B3 domain-containing transcription factor VRN1-like isoform X2 [Humulus lupulus]|uniref:B3 domain-containing transcription factor VRN1-like isoform X2 n=1 Tax=Humulus lupulus TaxID=3486 RepID=UPI002B403E9E|nr:B3 domain-containing transcription factor VRN1-like isoform X2 [Humulus lupulus]
MSSTEKKFPPITKCGETTTTSYGSIAADLDRTPLISRSSVPYFMLVAMSGPQVPLNFAKEHLKNEGSVILLIPDRGFWSAKFEIKHKSYSKRRAEFSCGWKVFAKDNYLKVGDVCIFELLKRSENVFKVSIDYAAEYASD